MRLLLYRVRPCISFQPLFPVASSSTIPLQFLRLLARPLDHLLHSHFHLASPSLLISFAHVSSFVRFERRVRRPEQFLFRHALCQHIRISRSSPVSFLFYVRHPRFTSTGFQSLCVSSRRWRLRPFVSFRVAKSLQAPARCCRVSSTSSPNTRGASFSADYLCQSLV